jgi:hypothetical protein
MLRAMQVYSRDNNSTDQIVFNADEHWKLNQGLNNRASIPGLYYNFVFANRLRSALEPSFLQTELEKLI